MPNETKETKRQNRASVWAPRITASQKHYEDWSKKFKVDDLEEAYYGFQWEDCNNPNEYMPYVMNMIYSSIDVKMPSLLFKNPVYTISPKPCKYDFDPTNAIFRAHLREDALNYFVQGGIKHFSQEVEMCILDAFFRFGILEIGYNADYIQNPDAGKPYLISETNPVTDRDGKVVRQPQVLTENERIYARRIPAERFRVGGIDQSNLERCSWYGYIDFLRKEDLLAAARTNKGYNSDVIDATDSYTPDSSIWHGTNLNIFEKNKWDIYNNRDVLAVWKIYDMRSKMHWMFNYSVSDIIYSERIERPKHFALKFRPMLKGFYPLPFTFNWISPQSEVNETREAARIHRRRFQRKFVVSKGAFEEAELDKLQNGGDGTFAVTEKMNAQESVFPIPTANLSAQHDQAMIISMDDFNRISGTSAEQRGQSDRTTATQSQIKEKRSEIRESRDKDIIADWLIAIGKEILLTAKENLALPFWIKVTNDRPGLFDEVTDTQAKYELITSEEFGDEDFDVDIKISSLSPVDQVAEKNKMVEFLSLVTQFPQVQMSPLMIQEIADRTGFRNERAIAEFVRMAQLLQTNQMLQLAIQSGQDPAQLLLESFMRNAQPGQQNPVAQRTVAQLTPPDLETIQNQVSNQLTQPQE